MPTTYENYYEAIYDALNTGEVSSAAGVDYSSWKNHIFDGGDPYIRGKNRGRIPFVSISAHTGDFSRAAFDGNYENISFDIRFDVGGPGISRSQHEMNRMADGMIRAFLDVLTSNQTYKNIAVSHESLVTTPFGGAKTITITQETVDEDDYGGDY